MKKWNTPAIAELNLEATESGFFCTEYECWPLINDSLKKCDQQPTNTNNNDNTSVDDGPAEKLS